MTAWLVVLVAGVALAGTWRLRLTWQRPSWILLSVLAVFVVLLGNDARRFAPIVVAVLGAGLLLPTGTIQLRGRRMAPTMDEARKTPGARVARPGKVAEAHEASVFAELAIPGYDLVERIGSGGMATVYRGMRRSDGTPVAVKIPMEQYTQDGTFLRRFHREAEVAQRIDHPNVVRTYDHGTVGAQHYLTMEFVDGDSLETFMEHGPVDVPFFVDVALPVVEALAAIHAAGFTHRDVKPGNVMIVRGGVREGRPRVDPRAVKLMDFGIAGSLTLTRLTLEGARVGTPVYMSPEQARGELMDAASDVYSLGLVFYEMLAGETAFQGTYEAVVHKQIYRNPPPLRQRNVQVPKALDALVMQMVAKDPAARPSLGEVHSVLADERNWEAAEHALLPVELIVAVHERQGVVRVLDADGGLHASLGDVGAGAFPSAPTAMSVASDGTLYAIVAARGTDVAHGSVVAVGRDGVVQQRFAPIGEAPGSVGHPVALAVSPVSGDVFVLDAAHGDVKRFDAHGVWRGVHAGAPKGVPGHLVAPRVLAVDGQGRLYVLDVEQREVLRYTASGRYETSWSFRIGDGEVERRELDGVAVDAAGVLYLSDATARRIRSIRPDGHLGATFRMDAKQGESTEGLLDLGVDADGRLFAARRGGHVIRRFASDGAHEATLETYAPVLTSVLHDRR